MGAATVAGDDGRLLGIITDGDLRRSITRLETTSPEALRAAMIMTRDPVVVAPDLLAYEALQLMENRPSQISVLPVVDDGGYCVGLLRLHDIVRSGL